MQRDAIAVTPASLQAAYQVHETIAEFQVERSLEYYRQRMAEKVGCCLVATLNEQAAGYMLIYDRYRDGSLYLWIGGVVPAFRRRGVFSALMAHAEQWARAQGFTKVRFQTRNRFRKMLSFLVARDYDFIKVVRKDAPPEEYRIHLEKRL